MHGQYFIIYMYFFQWQNFYLYSSFFDCAFWVFFFFCMSDHIIVLPDQNSDLPGHMSFQKKKKIAALYLSDAIYVWIGIAIMEILWTMKELSL